MKKVLFSFLVSLVLILSLNQLKVQASGTDSWNDLRMERMLLLDNDELKDSDGIVHLDDSFIDIYTTGALGCYEKNVETGEVTFSPAPEYISDEEPIPYQKETDNNEDEIDSFIIPNSIIGVDSRYKPNSIQAPFVNHCKLIMTFPDGNRYLGSGFMIDANTLLTAGHNLYDSSSGGFATKVVVAPKAHGSSYPYGTFIATNFAVGGEWASSQNPMDDWGIVRIPGDVGNRTGHLGFMACTPRAIIGKSIRIGGYPEDLNRPLPFEQYYMYIGQGKIISERTRALPSVHHNVDTNKGDSGAPLVGYEPNLGYTAYAIHNYGTSSTRPYNSATVINNWLLNKMRTWKK